MDPNKLDPKNLTIEEAVQFLPKNVAREYIERQITDDLDDNFIGLVKDWLKIHQKPAGVPYNDLVRLDRRYFKPQDEDKDVLARDKTIYRLATWLFDHEGDEVECRKKLKQQFPDLYVSVLEHFIDGDHDT